jgi:hypothetical protein
VLAPDAKVRLVAEIVNHERTHGRCTKTFLKKVRKQAKPAAGGATGQPPAGPLRLAGGQVRGDRDEVVLLEPRHGRIHLSCVRPRQGLGARTLSPPAGSRA